MVQLNLVVAMIIVVICCNHQRIALGKPLPSPGWGRPHINRHQKVPNFRPHFPHSNRHHFPHSNRHHFGAGGRPTYINTQHGRHPLTGFPSTIGYSPQYYRPQNSFKSDYNPIISNNQGQSAIHSNTGFNIQHSNHQHWNKDFNGRPQHGQVGGNEGSSFWIADFAGNNPHKGIEPSFQNTKLNNGQQQHVGSDSNESKFGNVEHHQQGQVDVNRPFENTQKVHENPIGEESGIIVDEAGPVLPPDQEIPIVTITSTSKTPIIPSKEIEYYENYDDSSSESQPAADFPDDTTANKDNNDDFLKLIDVRSGFFT